MSNDDLLAAARKWPRVLEGALINDLADALEVALAATLSDVDPSTLTDPENRFWEMPPDRLFALGLEPRVGVTFENNPARGPHMAGQTVTNDSDDSRVIDLDSDEPRNNDDGGW